MNMLYSSSLFSLALKINKFKLKKHYHLPYLLASFSSIASSSSSIFLNVFEWESSHVRWSIILSRSYKPSQRRRTEDEAARGNSFPL
jgi:hypothetical protein